MANQNLSSGEALDELLALANEYESKGYSIEWIYQDFDSVDEELYGALFDGALE
jgi:hypothetical protein